MTFGIETGIAETKFTNKQEPNIKFESAKPVVDFPPTLFNRVTLFVQIIAFFKKEMR